MQAKALGYSGEKLAADYLKNKGYEILDHNFTIRGGEIDLIARQKNILVFVEVKTRTGNSFGYGDESLNRIKKQRIHRAIQNYLEKHMRKLRDPDYRIDLVEIEFDRVVRKLKNITHFEDIEL